MEKSTAWYANILPIIGSLTDRGERGWIYLAVIKYETKTEIGVLFDLEANNRSDALQLGRTRCEVEYSTAKILEEWVYTTEEARGLDFRTFVGGTRPSTLDNDCGCGT